MPVNHYIKKPIPVPMCGPWDGTDEMFNEIRMFVAATNPHGVPRLDDGTLKVYDVLQKGWIPVQPGDRVVRGVEGENYPIAASALAKSYDLVETGAPC